MRRGKRGKRDGGPRLFLRLVVGSLLDDGVAKWVDLRRVRAEPHEPHAHDRRPHNDAAESAEHTHTHQNEKTSTKNNTQRQIRRQKTTTNPRSFMKGMKVKITPSTANTSVAMPIEPQ